MKLRRLLSFSILVLAVVALSPATAPAATDHQVPFKGSWQSVETSTGFPIATVVLEGTGNATHLGQFTVEGNFVINLLNGSGTGTEVFTAANGDTVNATYYENIVIRKKAAGEPDVDAQVLHTDLPHQPGLVPPVDGAG